MNVDNVSIAAVSADDTEAAVQLLKAQLLEHEIATTEEALRGVVRMVLDDERRGFMLLAHTNGRAAGVAYAAAHLSAEHGGLIGWLEELYVVPEYRARGVGSALLADILARAERLNWRGVELEVVAGHERAAALYVRHGFIAAPRSRYTRLFY